MIIFWILLGILFFTTLIFLILCISNLEIEVAKLKFDSTNEKHKKFKNYLFYIKIKLLDKFTIFKIRIDNQKVKKFKTSKIAKSKILSKISRLTSIENTILKNKKEIFKKENLRYINKLKILIKKINLYLEICTGDLCLTVYGVAIISSIISIILARNVKIYSKDKCKYNIIPIYNQKPSFKIELNCIINVKMVHIINIIYMLVKKRSVKDDERTSNRRAYVCSND